MGSGSVPSRGSSTSAARRPLGSRRASIELFLVSFLILFFELTCIRWFGSIVIFLTFFTNIVLMACFLGVSVGCLAASRRRSLIHGSIPGVLLAVGLACAVLCCYAGFGGRMVIALGGQRSPEEIYFGADSRIDDPAAFVVPIEVLAAVFFVVIAVVFVGLGQVLGRRFDAIPNRLAAYTADILGSMAGIAAFSAAAYWQVPATVWFVLSLALALYFTPRLRWVHTIAALGVLSIVALGVDWPRTQWEMETAHFWSPYNFVSYTPRRGWIRVNNLPHQTMQPVALGGAIYSLPHLLNRDAGCRSFRDVLIIGAGSGNDVAAALRYGAEHVDAVEIDPVLYELGRRAHPDHPYRDPRVAIHLEDGRGFVRTTPQRYDLIIYALVDSLALHSSYPSLRLESFLFTEEAFRDVQAKLAPGGVFILYNFFRQGWVVGRLEALTETVFGTRPVVVSLPYRETITAGDSQLGHITLLIAGSPGNPVMEAIRSRLARDRFFWLNDPPIHNRRINGYGPAPPPPPARRAPTGAGAPPPRLEPVGLSRVDAAGIDRIPTDDWPFLYLRRPTIPALNLRGMAIIGVLSLVILFLFAPMRRIRPDGPMFFLGAGFMLLEATGVVQMALLFGGTWVVNSIVFFAILTMILFANLYVTVLRPRRFGPYYALVLAALGVNSVVPMSVFLALPGPSKVIVSCAVVFVPIFFAGVIFATAFRASTQPDVDFGSNVGGIILGGLSEYLTLMLGFRHLLWVAIGYYSLSALFIPRRREE